MIFITISKRAVIIGIEITIINTLPPKSILFAIADSPESLDILTANSVKKDIPVILRRSDKNLVFILALEDISFNKFIILLINLLYLKAVQVKVLILEFQQSKKHILHILVYIVLGLE